MCLVSAFVCRILSESVGIFFVVNSSIWIVFISILCYYYLTDSVISGGNYMKQTAKKTKNKKQKTKKAATMI